MERSRLRPGDTILIVGMGSIGLLFVQLAKLQRARVIASDLLADRLALAQEYGADVVANPVADSIEEMVQEATAGRGVDLVLSTVASQLVLDQALSLVRDGGTIHFFAGERGGLTVNLNLNEFYEREISLVTTYSPSPQTLREALRLIVEGDVRTTELISHRLPLSDVLLGARMMVEQKARKVYFEL